MILLDIEVFATLISASRPSESTFTLSCSTMNLHASRHASLYPVIIVVGCIFALTSSFARRKSSAAMITTEVVPSPTSLSCFWARSTNIRPAGCSTSRRLRMVAPSLEIVTSYTNGNEIRTRQIASKCGTREREGDALRCYLPASYRAQAGPESSSRYSQSIAPRRLFMKQRSHNPNQPLPTPPHNNQNPNHSGRECLAQTHAPHREMRLLEDRVGKWTFSRKVLEVERDTSFGCHAFHCSKFLCGMFGAFRPSSVNLGGLLW